jgi:hypothetical protein
VNRNTWSVARFRFGATFARRRAGYLTLTLLIGLLGGLAMGSVAAARRTQSSFPQYVASTNPSQLTGVSAELLPGVFDRGYNPATIAKIARLPHVGHVVSVVGLNAFPITPSGAIKHIVTDFGMTFVGIMGGYGVDQDKPTIVAGRVPRLSSGHEFIADQAAVSKLHLHLGESVTFGVYSNAEEQSPAFGSAKVHPVGRVSATLVGIFISPQDVVEDDVDRSNGNIAFTSPVTSRFLNCCADFTESAVQVVGGSAAVTAVQHEIEPLTPKGAGPFSALSATLDKAERAIRPESIAIGAFGGIVALAALIIAGQLIGRQLRSGGGDAVTMRALGADPAMTAADGLLGTIGAVVVGALLAALVAVALSPLAPLGPVAPYYPTPGVAFDWTVLGGGVLILSGVLATLAGLLAYRYAPRRALTRSERSTSDGSRLVSTMSARLPAPAVVGVRFAVEPGRGVDPVPVRSVILGSVLALIIVMSTVIFGASLNSLVSHPSLYGWNWNYELASEFGSGNIPQAQATKLLARDHDVAAWSGAYFFTPKIDGQVVPIIAERPGATVAPPILTGHGLDNSHQVVLGAITLASLHKHIGQTVAVTIAVPKALGGTTTTRLRIVGTATLPTTGQGTELHLEMGSGALIPSQLIPAPLRSFGGSDGGPDVILVRLKPGVSPTAALPQLARAARAMGSQNNDGVVVHSVARPAEIVNYKTLGATPAVLGAALAVGAVAGLGLTLLASVRRRRRRDLALLKTLGFTTRQLSGVVATQATVAVALGAVVGVPLGIVVGRYLWDLFANEIHAVPAPDVSALAIVLITAGALVLGNLVALVPGRLAARTPAAAVLATD